MATEAQLIAALSAVFESPSWFSSAEPLEVGIGDDGAVFRFGERSMVAAADMSVEGVHFKREWSSLQEIGAKTTAANLADIYAMGGKPLYLLVTAGLPAGFTADEIAQLATGIASTASEVGARVIGGDLSSSPVLTLSITVLGEVTKPIRRSGARIGDRVVITGVPGWSAAGLHLLKFNLSGSNFDSRARALTSHRCPQVDHRAALQLTATGASAMCDVSDGLLSEANHIASDSKVGIEIELEEIAKSSEFIAMAKLAADLGADIWEWVLTGGEDHHFLATLPPGIELPEGAFGIGKVVTEIGVRARIKGELISKYEAGGWRHF
ncbi:MAG: thiamine-phosphate kinase [Actinomycetes bacterium]